MKQLHFTVLDTNMAKPAENLAWRLQWIRGAAKMQKANGNTNITGNPAKPLPQGEDLPSGIYELHLKTADYFKQQGWELPDPPVLDEITLRLHIEDTPAAYHLHIQIMPHSYNFAVTKNYDAGQE